MTINPSSSSLYEIEKRKKRSRRRRGMDGNKIKMEKEMFQKGKKNNRKGNEEGE